MAGLIEKISINNIVQDAFNSDGSVLVPPLYPIESSYNPNEKRNVVFLASELEKRPIINPAPNNFIRLKFQRDDNVVINKTENDIIDYKKKAFSVFYDFLKNKDESFYDKLISDFRKIDTADTIDSRTPFFTQIIDTKRNPLLDPNFYAQRINIDNFNLPLSLNGLEKNIPLGFAVHKTESNNLFFQTLFVEDNSLQPIDYYYYDVQLSNKLSFYTIITANLILRKGKKPVVEYYIKQSSFTDVYIPKFPPISPSISTTIYTNINNKILFLLQKGVGEQISKANDISLFSGKDINAFREKIEAKGQSYDLSLIYSIGGNEKYFVTYRTDEKPESYADIIKETNIIKKLDINKLETSFVDNVSPNTKYYYCFRTENTKGVLSDVTLVYEMQIVDQSGTIYMVQNLFKPEKKINFIKSLGFENRVRIFPTQLQINIPDKLLKVVGE